MLSTAPAVQRSLDDRLLLSDNNMRPVLRTWLAGRGRVVLEELGLSCGRVRVDLAAVGAELHGVELKSDRDSLRRLPGQAALYGKIFDRVTLAVGGRRLPEALALVPDWWGVARVTPDLQLEEVRRGERNAGVDPRTLVELLWHEEALALLAARGAARGVRGKPRRIVWDRVCETLSKREIAAAVRRQLRARGAGAARE